MELKEKVLRAAFWVGLTSALSKGVGVATTLILAKLLMPSDFGMIALASLITSAIGLFRELGLSRGLIVQKEEIEKSANTIFSLLILWNMFIYFLAFSFAPLLSAFFKEPNLTHVIRVLALTFIISSFGEVQLALLEKEMAFKKVSLVEAANLMLYGIISAILAFFGFEYWSIVYAQILAEIIKVSIIWAISIRKPVPSFNLSAIKGVLKFGGSITAVGIINYLIRNIDDAFVSRILGTASLGNYNFAYRIANVPATNVTNVIGRIMFPAYTQISESIFDLRNAFNKTFYFTSLITIPLSLMIVVFAPDFFHLFYGNKWDSAILPTQILAVFGLTRSLGSGMGGVFLAIRKPEIMLKTSSLQLILLTIFLYPATVYRGTVGVSILTTLCQGIVFIYGYIIFQNITGHSFIDLLKPIFVFSCLSIFSLIGSSVITQYIFTIQDKYYLFFTKVFFMGTGYICLLPFFARDAVMILRDTLKTVKKGLS